jgi:hypothetical protein
MPRLSDCIADCVRLAVPQPTEWQRIGNQIKAATILAPADLVNVSRASHRKRTRTEVLPQHGQQSIQPTERMKVEDGFTI